MFETNLPPSPGAREHVSIDLVNSVIVVGGNAQDALGTPEATSAWLVERDLVGDGSMLQSYCRTRLVGLRDHVHAAFSASVDGTTIDSKTLDGLNSALVAAPYSPQLRFDPKSGFFREVVHPITQLVEHAMSAIAEDAASLLTGEEAPLLARCQAEPCTRFFLRTHGRRQWCSTRCGDRIRAARAYARKRALVNS